MLSMVSSFLRNNKAVKISLDEMYKQEKGHKNGPIIFVKESIMDGYFFDNQTNIKDQNTLKMFWA